MGPARIATSFLRRWYESKYREQHRRPGVAFVIDLGFVIASVLLLTAAAWFAFFPVPTSGIRASFAAPTFIAGSPGAVDVTLTSLDGRMYRDVTLSWRLPPGAQVFVSNPRLSADGSVYLGQLDPDNVVSSRAVVRLFQPSGADAEFGYVLSYTDDAGKRQQFFGLERRRVTDTALVTDVPEAFHADGVVAEGAIIPVRVENRSDETLPFVHLLFRETPAHAEERIMLGDMAAHEVRWAYIPLQPLAVGDTARLEWSVGSAARNLSSASWEASVVAATVPTITGSLISRAGDLVAVSVEHAGSGSRVLVAHPFLDEPIQEQLISSPADTVLFTVPRDRLSPTHEWLAVPVAMVDGRRVLGPASVGAMSAVRFPFTAQVRYRSSAGDQLGAGPHPPRVGVETRYWVFWTVGPVDSALQNIVVEAALATGVTATGNTTAPNDGSYAMQDGLVRWTLPNVGPVDNLLEAGEGPAIENQVSEAQFGFEISVTPSADAVGSIPPLLGLSTARAEDTHTSLLFNASASPLSSALEEDGITPSAGVVRE